jgi:molybdate/tungstate transport system substrate-binding protein
MEILQKPDVIYGRSDPDSDPCGYRTVFTFQLAEKLYNMPGLTEKMILKNKEYIRPKEVDLVALLESGSIDYMFQYKSVAIQHNLKYIKLPVEINLSDPSQNENYKTASLEVIGSKPGTKMLVKGDYINYSLTILKQAPQMDEAMKFVEFLLSPEGTEILTSSGQKALVPAIYEKSDKVPSRLQKYVKKQ